MLTLSMCSTGRMCLSPSFKVVQDGGNRHRRDGQDNHEFAMIEVRVVFDGRMMFDSVETERVSEVVGIVYHEFAHGMARTTVSLSGGGGGGTTWMQYKASLLGTEPEWRGCRRICQQNGFD